MKRPPDRTTTSDGIVEIELNPRERRVYDRVRSLVSAPAPAMPLGVRDLLLFLPDLVVLLSRLMRDDRVPIGSKIIAVAGFAYVISPIDLMPVLLFGPLGLVDDLFIVASVLSRLVNHVHPDVVRGHWPGKGDALDVVHKVTRWGEVQVLGRLKAARWWLRGGRA